MALPLFLSIFISIFLISITCFQEERSIYLVLLEGNGVAFHEGLRDGDSSRIDPNRLITYTVSYFFNLLSPFFLINDYWSVKFFICQKIKLFIQMLIMCMKNDLLKKEKLYFHNFSASKGVNLGSLAKRYPHTKKN